jgi:hypothetical protein
MVRRVAAAQATLDKWQGVAFEWGRADCVRLAAAHLRNMGHKVSLSKGGAYGSVLSARRALKRAGFDSVADAVDGQGFARIPPASALVGDLLMLPGSDDGDTEIEGMGALAVALGNGRVLMWHPDADGATVCQPVEYQAAWRVEAMQ